jgi:hypothetical protein
MRRTPGVVTMPEEGRLNMATWFPALACVSLIIYLLLHRTSASQDGSAERLALLVGARRAWGESDASLRRRAIALSRWPYTQEAPVLAWWATLWGRIWRRRGR